MKTDDPGSVRSAHLPARRLLVCGLLLALAALGGIAINVGGGSKPATAGHPPILPGGAVSHSAHYTLTAEIHAGS